MQSVTLGFPFSFQDDRLPGNRRGSGIIGMVRSVDWSVSRSTRESRIGACSVQLMKLSNVTSGRWCRSSSLVGWYIFRTCVWRPLRFVARLRSLPRARLRRGQTKPTPTNASRSTSRGKKKGPRDVFERSSSKLRSHWRSGPPFARTFARRTERNERLPCRQSLSHRRDASETRRFTPFTLNSRRERELFSSRGRGFVLPVKMRSPAACSTRRVRGATFDEDEPSIVALSFSEANSTTCHCHCPSSSCDAFGKDDGTPSPPAPTAACDLCERLRGQTGGCYDPVDAIWTGDGHHHVADRSSRQKRDKNDPLANDSEAVVGKRDRTLRCDRTSLRESSARCASSVVRWISAVRFHGDFKSTEWRSLLWIVLLILAVPDLAAAHDTATGPSNRGEYALSSLLCSSRFAFRKGQIINICIFFPAKFNSLNR